MSSSFSPACRTSSTLPVNHQRLHLKRIWSERSFDFPTRSSSFVPRSRTLSIVLFYIHSSHSALLPTRSLSRRSACWSAWSYRISLDLDSPAAFSQAWAPGIGCPPSRSSNEPCRLAQLRIKHMYLVSKSSSNLVSKLNATRAGYSLSVTITAPNPSWRR